MLHISDIIDKQNHLNRVTLSHWNIFLNTTLNDAIDILEKEIIPNMKKPNNSFHTKRILNVLDFKMRSSAFKDIEKYSDLFKLWLDAEIREFHATIGKSLDIDHYIQEDNFLCAKILQKEPEHLYNYRQDNVTYKAEQFLDFIKNTSQNKELMYKVELEQLNKKYGK